MLPDWIAENPDKPGHYRVDAHAAYTLLLEEFLEAERFEELDQYWIEVIYTWLKLDVQMALKTAGLLKPGQVAPVNHWCAPEHKATWAWRSYPPGKYAEIRAQGGQEAEMEYAKAVGLEAKALYKEVRGYIPA